MPEADRPGSRGLATALRPREMVRTLNQKNYILARGLR